MKQFSTDDSGRHFAFLNVPNLISVVCFFWHCWLITSFYRSRLVSLGEPIRIQEKWRYDMKLKFFISLDGWHWSLYWPGVNGYGAVRDISKPFKSKAAAETNLKWLDKARS